MMGSLQEYPRRDGIAAGTVCQQRSTAMGYHFREADIEPLLLMIADQMHGSSRRSDDPARRTPAIVDLISNMAALARLSAEPAETRLCVGPLELDLIDRTAKRGDRPIDLRPREFQLLKYMMQRSGELVTRAALFKDVWNYKFVPESNLVDVHMGRLRRKVDGSNETSMICNVRGAGFILASTQ
jgi:DNA-binding response OmpR family regulator